MSATEVEIRINMIHELFITDITYLEDGRLPSESSSGGGNEVKGSSRNKSFIDFVNQE